MLLQIHPYVVMDESPMLAPPSGYRIRRLSDIFGRTYDLGVRVCELRRFF